MKNNKDEEDFLLDDIESDIDKDWEEISNKFKQKEEEEFCKREELWKELSIPMFPSFEEFYLHLYRIFKSWDGGQNIDFASLHSLLNRILSTHQENKKKLPKGFNTLWNIMCDPRNYSFDIAQCKRCSKEYNIFYKNIKRSINQFFEQRIQQNFEIYMDRSIVYCPNCSLRLKEYIGRQVVCIFETHP